MDIIKATDKRFASYGVVIDNKTFSDADRQLMRRLMEDRTEIPEAGNVYVADFEPFHSLGLNGRYEQLYDGEKLQYGYCNGQNTKVNALEWHDSPEITVAITPCVLFLGLQDDLKMVDGKYQYNTEDLIAVELAKGDIVMLHNQVLHFAPVKVTDAGFKTIIILPKGTNTPLEGEQDDPYMFMTNKRIVVHKEHTKFIERGAKIGVVGENYDWNDM